MKDYKRFQVPAVFVKESGYAPMAHIMCGEGLGSSWILISEMFIGEDGVAISVNGKMIDVKKTIVEASKVSLAEKSSESDSFFIFDCSYDDFTDWQHQKDDEYFLQDRISCFEDVLSDFASDTGLNYKKIILKGVDE